MLALSVFYALRDAVASVADYRLSPQLDAPATDERILASVEESVTRREGACAELARRPGGAGRARRRRSS